ncbi:unnamed protein product [Clavelina lepadiformis]|uniref:Uncharacterized protein n=1 Tax=Clavelina lepadiformis TaxID=159417 RepID=A0ABP0FR72_CLALP
MWHFIYFIYALCTVVVAEWLRRQTRNLLGLARVGSNPADNADITFAISYGYSEMYDFNYFIYALGTVVVAEWLRRQTRNLLGPARVRSNPADNADITFAISYGYSEMWHFIYFIYALCTVVVAEWLRRQTRNLLGHDRVGSNPADNADITFAISYGYSEMWHFIYFIYALCTVVVAEWLGRQTRNLLGQARHSCRGGVVKATDSKSVGPCPRRFESCRQRRYYFCNFKWIFRNVRFYLFHLCIKHSCRGRVVMATDSKSVVPCQRRFESRRQRRYYFCNFIWILHLHMNMKPGGGWRVLILQWKNQRTSIDKLQVQTSEPQSDEPTTV